MQNSTQHTFHIPVMGLAFTIDSPIKVARFGISSVVSIVESRLIEMMRKHYYPLTQEKYFSINTSEEDYLAKRVTDYLNLMSLIVKEQVEKLKNATFEKGSEIVKYFELLPDNSPLKKMYLKMIELENTNERKELQKYLKSQICAGSIDVNIMTKIDRDNYNKNGELIQDGSEAIAALRGYANSNLENSSVIFSAGMNLRLYNYLENLECFQNTESGINNKKIIIKVSDYRSALIQGKYLAKKGIWVSEFRIESGLNCGGHAFATDGFLLGPILEEFKVKKNELVNTLSELYNKAIFEKFNRRISKPLHIKISVQGGIGNNEEHELLKDYFEVNSIGWGTPFLLVPEATTVDDKTLQLLCNAKEDDLLLSRNSPLGVRFHYLKNTSSEQEKLKRINDGKPGSPCTEKHLALNTEFTKDPICTASKQYQKLKIADLQTKGLSDEDYQKQLDDVLNKECLCIGLSNSAAINYSQTLIKKLTAVTICPGPNIINFSKLVSLKSMIDHIYGRDNIITNSKRSHMFITELRLYITYLREQLAESIKNDEVGKLKKYFSAFYNNLKEGIAYYFELSNFKIITQINFINDLNFAKMELEYLSLRYSL